MGARGSGRRTTRHRATSHEKCIVSAEVTMQSTSNPLPDLLRASADEIEALEAAMDQVR